MPTAQEITSSVEFAQMCEDVKQAIFEIVVLELVPVLPAVVGERVPKVVPMLLFDKDDNIWAGMLRSNRHKVTVASKQVEKIHCYMVGYGGIANYANNTNRTMPFAQRFVVISYYQDDAGTAESNAEKAHGFEMARLAYALNNTPNLNMPGVVVRTVEYRERREMTRIGDNQVREGVIEFFVELQPVPKMYQ